MVDRDGGGLVFFWPGIFEEIEKIGEFGVLKSVILAGFGLFWGFSADFGSKTRTKCAFKLAKSVKSCVFATKARASV